MTRSAVLGPYQRAALGVGLDIHDMVELAGLPPEALDNTDLQISTALFAELLSLSRRESSRDDFALLTADQFKISTLGPLGLLMREQPTLGQALAVYDRYAEAAGDPLLICGEAIAGGWRLTPIPSGGAAEAERLTSEMAMGAAMRILAGLVGADWRPRRTCLTRAAPADAFDYRARFGRVDFGCQRAGLILSEADLARPIAQGDPDMALQIARLIQAQDSPPRMGAAGQVSALIAELLPTGACTIDHVARRLGVDRRTVHRRLLAEGQTFTGLVERRRRTLVNGPLGQGDRPLSAVARQLGFANLSSFSRWYRQAHGDTARHWRAEQGKPPTIS